MNGRNARWGTRRFFLLAVVIGFAFQPLGLEMTRVLTDALRAPLLWHEGDTACLEMCTINAARLTQTLGVYSRFDGPHLGPFGGSHLGPLYFYWLAPFYVALGRNVTAMSFGVLVLHVLSVALLLAILLAAFRRQNCHMIFVSSLLLVVYLRLIPLVSIWNPDVLALPFCLFLYAAALLGTGYSPAMPLVLLTGSFCVQTHFGTGPCVATVTAASLALFARRRMGIGEWRRGSVPLWIGLTCFVMITIWLPPLLEQVQNSPGNLWKFITFLRYSKSDMRWFEGAAEMAAKVSWAPTVARAAGLSLQKSFLENISFVLIVLQLVGAAAMYYSKSSCSLCRSLAIITPVAILTGLVSVANIRMGVYDFLTEWMSAIGFVGYSLLATTCIRSRWRMNRTSTERPEAAPDYAEEMTYTLPALLLLLSLFVAGTAINNSFSWSGKVGPRGSLRVKDLSQELIVYLTKKEFHGPEIVATPDRLKWVLTTGIGLELEKGNQSFSLSNNRLGSNFRPSRADDAVILIADKPCSSEICVPIATDMLPESKASVVPGDGDTFVFSVELPSRITAQRLFDSLVDLFGSPVRAIPGPLTERIWKIVHSLDAKGRLAYSISTDSSQNLLQPLLNVSVHAFAGGLRVVSSRDSPRTVTQSLDLRNGGLFFLLVDVNLDHDDVGQVFYGRRSQDFSEEDSTSFVLFEGRNVVGIPLSSPETLQRIRFDPGRRRGNYILAGFSIKELSGGTILRRLE